jgi:uncharacterized membrane protein HdeD (DUF308 family)
VNKRPIIVTMIAWLLIATGVFRFAVHFRELLSERSFPIEDLWIPIVGLLSAVPGAFILLGRNWARWLVLALMAFQLAIMFGDSIQKVAAHVLLFSLIAYSLFRSDATAYFQHSHHVAI